MGKDADQDQTQCEAYQLSTDREEIYAVFVNEDWRSPFMQYPTSCYKGIMKDTSLRDWQHVTFCITESFSRKGMMGTHYDVWVPRKQVR